MAGKQEPLNTQQRRFIKEYKKCRNSTQAAIRAGYSPKSASSTGSHLRHKNPEVKKRLDAWEAEQEEQAEAACVKVEITVEWCLMEAKNLYLDPGTSTKDKVKLLEMLGRRCGAFEPAQTESVLRVEFAPEMDDWGT